MLDNIAMDTKLALLIFANKHFSSQLVRILKQKISMFTSKISDGPFHVKHFGENKAFFTCFGFQYYWHRLQLHESKTVC